MTLIPTQVVFRGLTANAAIEREIRERVAWLEHVFTGIVRCRVLVAVPHRHRRDGRHVQVRVEITLPGEPTLVVNHEPSLHGTLKDVEDHAHRKDADIDNGRRHASVAVRQAFDVARRRLEDVVRQQRGFVKAHETAAQGPA